MMETISEPTFKQKSQYEIKNGMVQKNKHNRLAKVRDFLLEKSIFLYMIGFLLGRAVILANISPFPIAFLATVWFIQRKRTFNTSIILLAGALTVSIEHASFVMLGMVTFILPAYLFNHLNKQRIIVPLLAFLATFLAQLFIVSIQMQITAYDWLLLFTEGFLASVLVLIFMQSIPLISPKRYKQTLKNEEIICLVILMASILTGTIGWSIYGVALEQVFSRYIVLMLAFIGGAAIGSTVGVVAGLVLSLANVTNFYQISLLAFSGLLGGLLKEGKKFGVSLGLFVGTALIGMYGGISDLFPFFLESMVAILLFLLTPLKVCTIVSRYIPGTEEYEKEQEQYVKKIRNVTAERVHQFSSIFEALSKSFSTDDQEWRSEQEDLERETDYFLSDITEKTCQSCLLKERCWQRNFDKTYPLMKKVKEELQEKEEVSPSLEQWFTSHCIQSDKVIQAMKEKITSDQTNEQLKSKILESRQFVANQLQGVSKVMENFSKEILKEKEDHEKQEVEIVQMLEGLGIELEKVHIYQLKKGNIDIEITASFYDYRGEGEKIIAPALSDILDEMIVVKKEKISPFPNGYSFLKFGSAIKYVIETGVAQVARGGGFVSGDSYAMLDVDVGKYAIAISDGMGNGKRAKEESEETLRLLKQILQAGLPEAIAIQSINSILALRTTDEIYATLDLAVINLHNAYVKFLKVGSTPTFIKRGNKVFHISANNLPIGILPELEMDVVSDRLKSGDVLVMMSDGIYDGPEAVRNNDIWLQRKIKNMETDHPQEIADLLLEEVIRANQGVIEDDMTVLVAKISKNKPKWAAIRWEKETSESHSL